MSKGGIKAIFAYYQTLGQNFVDALEDMLVFDAIICNTDRHYGNFGVLVDNKTNAIAAPAPLFDHGNALSGTRPNPKRWMKSISIRKPTK